MAKGNDHDKIYVYMYFKFLNSVGEVVVHMVSLSKALHHLLMQNVSL